MRCTRSATAGFARFRTRVSSNVSLRKTHFIQPHVLFTGVYLLKRLFVGFWVYRRASPLDAAPVSSLFGLQPLCSKRRQLSFFE